MLMSNRIRTARPRARESECFGSSKAGTHLVQTVNTTANNNTAQRIAVIAAGNLHNWSQPSAIATLGTAFNAAIRSQNPNLKEGREPMEDSLMERMLAAKVEE